MFDIISMIISVFIILVVVFKKPTLTKTQKEMRNSQPYDEEL